MLKRGNMSFWVRNIYSITINNNNFYIFLEKIYQKREIYYGSGYSLQMTDQPLFFRLFYNYLIEFNFDLANPILIQNGMINSIIDLNGVELSSQIWPS